MKMRWSAERLMRQRVQPSGPTLYCLIPEFISTTTLNAFVAFAIERQERFGPSTVQNATDRSGTVSPWQRSSKVLRDLEDLGRMLRAEIQKAAVSLAPRFGLSSFIPGCIEVELTSSNDGDFFRVHRDDVSCHDRILSYVCFVHAEPKRFEGGTLHLYSHDSKQEIVIEPLQRSLVLFRSSLRHEVQRVSVRSRQFADSRLTLNGWIHAARH